MIGLLHHFHFDIIDEFLEPSKTLKDHLCQISNSLFSQI